MHKQSGAALAFDDRADRGPAGADDQIALPMPGDGAVCGLRGAAGARSAPGSTPSSTVYPAGAACSAPSMPAAPARRRHCRRDGGRCRQGSPGHTHAACHSSRASPSLGVSPFAAPSTAPRTPGTPASRHESPRSGAARGRSSPGHDRYEISRTPAWRATARSPFAPRRTGNDRRVRPVRSVACHQRGETSGTRLARTRPPSTPPRPS